MTAIQPAPDVMGELNAIKAAVREQLGELLDTLDTDGGRYADTYAAWFVASAARRTGPPPPPALAGQPAALIRGLVQDVAYAVRMHGGVR